MGHALPFPQVTSESVHGVQYAAMDRQTQRHTHTYRQTRVTNIHFASSTTHVKCN